ncbi:MAG: LptE family protein [Lentisphaerae bacterium]|nr:LptE family protein [Lentisphaerota bacterium]
MKRLLTFLKILLPASVLLVGNGCAGYKLGSSLPPNIKSIYVPVFVNKCGEPLIEVEATNETIGEFQREGTLKVTGEDKADAILQVTLDTVTLTPLRYDRERTSTPSEYRMTLTASFVLKRAASTEVVGEEPSVSGEATFIYSGNLTTAKRNAIPTVSKDLAKRIVEKVVEIW